MLPPEEGLPSTTPLQYAIQEISLRIKCLMRLSVVLKQPAPRDLTEKCAMIPIAHFEQPDIDRVSNKFPQAPPFLVERLGKANTKRRQLFKYLEKHHKALYVDGNIEDPAGEPESKRHGDGPRDNRDGSLSSQTMATTTTVRAIPRQPETLETDCFSESRHTATSYTPTVAGGNDGSEGHLAIPVPPKSAEPLGEHPFLCCYCHSIINPSTTESWEYVLRSSGKVLCLRIV